MECEKDQIYVNELGRCLHVFCPTPQVFKNGSCVNLENTCSVITTYINPGGGIPGDTTPDSMLTLSAEVIACLNTVFLSYPMCKMKVADVSLADWTWRVTIRVWHHATCNTTITKSVITQIAAMWSYFCQLFETPVSYVTTGPVYGGAVPLLRDPEHCNEIYPHDQDCRRFVVVTKEEMESVPSLRKYGVPSETMDPYLDQLKKTSADTLVVLCMEGIEEPPNMDSLTDATLEQTDARRSTTSTPAYPSNSSRGVISEGHKPFYPLFSNTSKFTSTMQIACIVLFIASLF